MKEREVAFDSINIQKINLNSLIADKIQEIIASEKLAPGTQLPTERQLSEQLKVNRNTLREAFRILQHRGLINMQQGKGTYVISVSVDKITESIKMYATFGNISIHDLLELRNIIEPEIAALAAVRVTDTQVEELGKHVKNMERAVEKNDIATYIVEDELFHEILAEATDNELLNALVKGLHEDLLGLRAEIIRELLEVNKKVNTRVYEAIKKKDPEKARKAMLNHMKIAIKIYQAKLKEHEANKH